VIPVTAPIAAVWGLIWRRGHEEEIGHLPPLHAALSRIAVTAAIAVTIGLAVMTALYALVRRA
jgi:hypothetical protein